MIPQLDAVFVHLEDQARAACREAADLMSVNLHDPHIARAVKLVADSILAAGQVHEPDHQKVANAHYCFAMAWGELVK